MATPVQVQEEGASGTIPVPEVCFRGMYPFPEDDYPLRGDPMGGGLPDTLGVRVPIDIRVDNNNMVRPIPMAGMTVAPGSIKYLHPRHVPMGFMEGATGDSGLVVYSILSCHFSGNLILNKPKPTHGVVSPAKEMLFSDYFGNLILTRDSWKKVPKCIG